MGKFWQSEATLECDFVEKPDADESQPWRDAYDEFFHNAQNTFWEWVANFHSAALAGGFEVGNGHSPAASPFEHYASYKLKDDSECYATRPFYVHFKLVLHPGSVEREDFKRLTIRLRQIRFESLCFANYAEQLTGVANWCSSIQRHKVTGRRGSSSWSAEQR